MVIEIIMIVLGIALVVAGYVIPSRKEDNDDIESFSRDQVQEMVSEEVETVKGRVDDIVDETVQYAIEKAERSMDRLSNEKMMAVSEYSDTVLEQINKSHEEVVFLYGMLNDKHENLKETVAEAARTASEVEEKARKAEEELAPIVASATAAATTAATAAAEIKENTTVQEAESPAPARTRNKPVPVIKKEPLPIPDAAEDAEEDINDDYVEDEWEDYDESDDDDEGLESDGPVISFNPRSPGSRNSNERILELHKAGKSNMAIAKELGLGVGEVKLVIDLFKGM